MTDVAKTEIHPDTLKFLKDSQPGLQEIATEIENNELLTAGVHAVSDGLRKAFPGLDDLTLAAFMLYSAGKAHELYHMYRHDSWEKEMLAASLVAYDLSWSIRNEGDAS